MPDRATRLGAARPAQIGERARSSRALHADLQERLESAGLLHATRAGERRRPLFDRLDEAGLIPATRTAGAEDPPSLPRTPMRREMDGLSRPELLRLYLDEEVKHRDRLAQLERLQEIERTMRRPERDRELRELRSLERDRYARVHEEVESRFDRPTLLREVVDALDGGGRRALSRTPDPSTLRELPAGEALRVLIEDEAEHRLRMAELDRLERLASEGGRAARVEEVRELRRLETARHERVRELGTARLESPDLVDRVVEELAR